MSSEDADGHQKTKEGPIHWVQKEIVFFQDYHNFGHMFSVFVGFYTFLLVDIAVFVVPLLFTSFSPNGAIAARVIPSIQIEIITEVGTIIFIYTLALLKSKWDWTSQFVQIQVIFVLLCSNIFPRYPNHSIPLLRIQYVDYISGAGVSDPDKGEEVLETFLSLPLRYSTTGPDIGYTYRISQLIWQ